MTEKDKRGLRKLLTREEYKSIVESEEVKPGVDLRKFSALIFKGLGKLTRKTLLR